MSEAPRYPIGAVAQLTGLPVDTLRAWERRHAVVVPGRDARGRVYSADDVRKLRLLRTLVERGHAIGRLAALDEEALSALDAAAAPQPASGVERAAAAVERFDAAELRRELGVLASLFPPRTLVLDVVLPLLRRVGDGWMRGRISVAQEHLASAALRDLLGTLARTHAPESPPLTLVFATPPGERHELGVLAAAMLAAGGGLGAVYLGPDLPPAEVAAAARLSGARAAVVGVLAAASAEAAAAREIDALAAALPRGVELWVGGRPLTRVVAAAERAGGRHLPDFERYVQALAGLGARF